VAKLAAVVALFKWVILPNKDLEDSVKKRKSTNKTSA